MSAATASGFGPLLDRIVEMLDELPPVLEFPETDLEIAPMYEEGFKIERRAEDGVFVVTGGDVQRILDTTDPDDEVSMRRFQQLLIRFGIIAALREMGADDGDTVELGGWQFDFMN